MLKKSKIISDKSSVFCWIFKRAEGLVIFKESPQNAWWNWGRLAPWKAKIIKENKCIE